MAEGPSEALVGALTRLLEEASEVVGADYAALGILDENRMKLKHFITVGVDEATRKAIGDEPRGRGVLGLLIEDPKPLRLHDVTTHERSYGFPPGHPDMRAFLGLPIMIEGKPWGNLYFTQTRSGSFDEADEARAQAYATRVAHKQSGSFDRADQALADAYAVRMAILVEGSRGV